MNKLFKTPILVALSLAILTTTSCKKRDASVADQDLPEAASTESSSDNSKSDEMQTHVYTVVHTEVSNVEEQSFKTGGATVPGDQCATIYKSFDTILVNSVKYGYLDSMIIDYGYGNSCDWNGRTKEGKIIITKNRKLSMYGCVTTVQLDSFFVAGYRVKGTSTLTNETAIGTTWGSFKLHITVVGGQVISPDKSEISSWTTNRTMLVDLAFNNVITRMYGTSNGVNHLGQSYTATVLDNAPLLFVYGCKYPQKGIVTISSSGNPTLEVDFSGGNGACDNLAVVKINGTKYKQTLGL